jgi:hypothetical protein
LDAFAGGFAVFVAEFENGGAGIDFFESRSAAEFDAVENAVVCAVEGNVALVGGGVDYSDLGFACGGVR